MIAAAQWLRIWMFGVEVAGSNAGKFFPTFSCTFLPCGDFSIRVFQPYELQLFGFCLVTLYLSMRFHKRFEL